MTQQNMACLVQYAAAFKCVAALKCCCAATNPANAANAGYNAALLYLYVMLFSRACLAL